MSLPLDIQAGALAAYGMRRLRAAYSGYAIRVLRDSDSVEQDIGFSGDDLDAAALASFVGSGSAHLRTWYDQSGNGYDLANSGATSSMLVVADTGTVATLASRPVLNVLAGSARTLSVSGGIPLSNGSGLTMIAAFQPVSWVGSNPGLWRDQTSSTGPYFNIFQSTTGRPWIRWNGTDILKPASGYALSTGTPYVTSWAVGSATTYLWRSNGATQYSGSNPNTTTSFGGIYNLPVQSKSSGEQPSGLYADLIFYPSALSASALQPVEDNIGAYYGIYTPATTGHPRIWTGAGLVQGSGTVPAIWTAAGRVQ